jgi:hypothetical protein
MLPYLRPACFAVALFATAAPAAAQTWVYEPDDYARAWVPRLVSPAYESRAYNAYAYQPLVTEQPVATTRRTVSRTIIPQGRGRAPIVRERVTTDTTVARPRVVSRAVDAYAYAPRALDAYAYAPRENYVAPVVRERVISRPVVNDYAYAPGALDAYAYAPGPVATPVVTTVAPRYRALNNRLWLVDPLTGAVVGEQTSVINP